MNDLEHRRVPVDNLHTPQLQLYQKLSQTAHNEFDVTYNESPGNHIKVILIEREVNQKINTRVM